MNYKRPSFGVQKTVFYILKDGLSRRDWWPSDIHLKFCVPFLCALGASKTSDYA